MDNVYRQMFAKIIKYIKPEDFKLPIIQPENLYFPDFFEETLMKFSNFYNNNLTQQIDNVIPFDGGNQKIIITKINNLNTALIETINLYYKGKITEASKVFFSELDKLLFDEINARTKINSNYSFFRARIDNKCHFSKSDLFHIDFKLRHIVSTNRFSVPGFPALYLGDTTYVCWEEFNRHRLRDIWFVRIENQRELNILQIQRIEDFLSEICLINQDLRLTFLLRYLLTFPLSIACSIKVKNPNGNFKPEYIIPQLLLEYISMKDEIDGIKFPSTKVDYDLLYNVKAYNYVFPVKKIAKNGFCSVLTDTFYSTEPTSLELEEILYNPTTHPMVIGGGVPNNLNQIELIKNQKTYYATTSFGKLEGSLFLKNAEKI